MDDEADIGGLAVRLGYASGGAVREARKFQLRARILNGLDIGVGEALFWQGVLTPRQLDRLLREADGREDVAGDGPGVLRFGDVAILLGFVTEAQLEECLEIQRCEDARGDRHRLIGEILLERGYIARQAVEEVVDLLVDRAPPPEA